MSNNNYLEHSGRKGMKWYVRRWQNEDGSLTPAGRIHYDVGPPREKASNGSSDAKSRARVKMTNGSSSSSDAIKLQKLKNKAEKDARKAQEKKEKAERKAKEKAEQKEREEKEKAEKEARDRQDILDSNDASKILANKDKYHFTNDELRAAVRRIKDDSDTAEEFYKLGKTKATTPTEKELKDRFEADKKLEKILKSGDINELLKNQDKYSIEQINSGIERINMRNRLDDIRRDSEKRESRNKIDDALSKISHLADLTMSAAEVYEKFKIGKERLFNARSNWDQLPLNDKLNSAMSGTATLGQLSNLLGYVNTAKSIASGISSIKNIASGKTDDVNSANPFQLMAMMTNPNVSAEAKGEAFNSLKNYGLAAENFDKWLSKSGLSKDEIKAMKDSADSSQKLFNDQQQESGLNIGGNSGSQRRENQEDIYKQTMKDLGVGDSDNSKKKGLFGRKEKEAPLSDEQKALNDLEKYVTERDAGRQSSNDSSTKNNKESKNKETAKDDYKETVKVGGKEYGFVDNAAVEYFNNNKTANMSPKDLSNLQSSANFFSSPEYKKLADENLRSKRAAEDEKYNQYRNDVNDLLQRVSDSALGKN